VTFISNGGNLESGTSCAFTAASDQQSVADLGLNGLGSYGGETLTHDLLPDSPAIDAGRRRICNHQANKKDQRGLARFYDGNGDRRFDCDSGPVEYQGLVANPGFEEPLDAASDWSLVASGGGDGRVRLTEAPSGKFAFVFQANAALETLSQTVAVAGGSGETYALTLLASGSGVTVGDEVTVTLASSNGGAPADTRTCTFRFPSTDFARPTPACVLTTTAAYDALDVVVAWDGATTGSLALNAMSLTRG
jgi:predicted RecA/RadA family phage recombinase